MCLCVVYVRSASGARNSQVSNVRAPHQKDNAQLLQEIAALKVCVYV